MSLNKIIDGIRFIKVASEKELYAAGTYLHEGYYALLVRFDSRQYPLTQHCRYVHHRDQAIPYTFPNMEFAEKEPGLRVGPWPGWRDIPPMPKIILRIGDREYRGRFDFWGDELTQHHLRGVFNVEVHDEKEIFLNVEDERLIPREANVYETEFHRTHSIEVKLKPELVDKHPRLFFTQNGLVLLRQRAQTSHKEFRDRITLLLDSWQLPFEKTPESKVVDGPERLAPEDRAFISSFISSIDPSEENKTRAVRSLLDFIAETEKAEYEPLKIDTQCGEMLFCMCGSYDLCYEFLEEDVRVKVEKRLGEIADICWGHLGYERTDYAQAHFLGCAMGVLAFSFLFWEKHPRAKEWASYLRGVLDRIISMLPDDGFYPHGINLWIYEHGFLFRWIELFNHCAGENLWMKTSYWKHASRFRAAATSPDGLYGITFGDPQFRIGGDSWCHYLIASHTTSIEAQWLARVLRDQPTQGVDFRHIPPRRRVYEFLYYDPSITSVQPVSGNALFEDGGQLFIKSDATDRATLFSIRSGAPLGKRRYHGGEYGGYGHSDPMHGAFLLYHQNTFLACGPGPSYRRDTSFHNTITIDGQGQIGDSAVWIPDFIPPEYLCNALEVREFEKAVSIRADVTKSYLPHLGIKQCVRNMYVDLRKFIIGVDTISLDAEHEVEWNYHSWVKMNEAEDTSSRVIDFENMKNVRLHILNPKLCRIQTGVTEMAPAYPHDGRRDYYLRVSKGGTEVTFVWCLALNQAYRPQLDYTPANEFAVVFSMNDAIVFHENWLLPL